MSPFANRIFRRRVAAAFGLLGLLLLAYLLFRLHRRAVPSRIPPARPPVSRDPNYMEPVGIVLHDSDTPARYGAYQVNAAYLSQEHAEEHPGWAISFEGHTYHLGYHFVILPDGTVQAGRPEHCVGAHARGHNNWLGICLVGGFSTNRHWFPRRPTHAQMRSLIALCERLMSTYHIPPHCVRGHRDINDTWCPGDRFPFTALLKILTRYAAAHPETQPPPGRIVSLAKPPRLHHKKRYTTPSSGRKRQTVSRKSGLAGQRPSQRPGRLRGHGEGGA